MLRSIMESAVLHICIIAAFIMMSQNQLFKAGAENKQIENIIMSTSILETVKPEPPASPVQPIQPVKPVKPKPAKNKKPVTKPVKAKKETVKPKPEAKPIKETVIEEPVKSEPVSSAPADTVAEVHKASESGGHTHGTASVKSSSNSQSGEASKAAPTDAELTETYRTEHFRYILSSIRSNLRYPMIARRNGWEGRVDVSFLIKKNGHIDDLSINRSCGFNALDESAMQAVRKSAPFPPPPVEAYIVVPLVFGLN